VPPEPIDTVPETPAPAAASSEPTSLSPLPPLPAASLSRMWSLVRPEWRRLALGSLFLVLASAASLLYPQGIRAVIDGALDRTHSPSTDRVALFMAVVSLVFAVATAFRHVLFAVAGERVVARLRDRLYRTIVEQEVAFFDLRRTGELTSRLASDTGVLQSAVSNNVSHALRNAAQALGGLTFLFYTAPLLTALMLAALPGVGLAAAFYGRRIRRYARDVQDELAGAGEIAEETIAGLRTVRSFDAEKSEAARYGRAIDRVFQLARRRVHAGATFMGVASFVACGSAVLVFWYGGRMVSGGNLTIGALTSFLVYTLIVAFALGGLADLWTEFMRASGAADRVFELLERKPAMPAGGGLRPEQAQGRIDLVNLRFSYPSRPGIEVLRNLRLTLEPGEVVALVGPSGAGKSTIAGLIPRFYDPQGGRVLFDGHDVRTLDPGWLRRQVGTVAQEPVLFSTSIAENIRYGRPGASRSEVEAAAAAANAHGFILSLPGGYDTLVGERGLQLSGGQKQRVAIARAVLKDPRVLVLDEATSALDSESERLVKEALERLMRGRTTLIIAHRLSTVVDADRVVVIEGGQIVQSGPHARLMTEDGPYRRLVERQFSGIARA
jgi:ABC transporter fused permease/ATP-binding protein